MPLTHIPLEDLTETHLQALITGGVREGRRIEYKRELPGNSDDEKREFLADVTSFANASGGDLLSGVEEDAGLPVALLGIGAVDADREILRLDQIIRTGVDPRLPGVHIRPVPLSGGASALVIRVPQSWTLPHMVTFKNYSRFFSRTSAGKYQLDVSELRSLFARSGEAAERIRRFRDERLSRIVAGEGAFVMSTSGYLVLHLMPLRLFDPVGMRLNLTIMPYRTQEFSTLRSFGGEYRYNLDGFVRYVKDASDGVASYVQMFRHGVVEAVDDSLMAPPHQRQPAIPGRALINDLLTHVPRYMQVQRELGVEVPMVLLLTLIGVKGYRLLVNSRSPHQGQPIDRDVVQIPEVIIEDWGAPLETLLRPSLDALWNAAGFSRCTYYDENGILHLER